MGSLRLYWREANKMKKFRTVIFIFVLILLFIVQPRMSAQAASEVVITVATSSEKALVGDEIKTIISISNVKGMDLSSFSFRIKLPDELKYKSGSAVIETNFQNKTGMFMTAFDETPFLMVSGFGDTAFNGDSIEIASFTWIASLSGIYKIDLYDVKIYNIDIKQIPTIVMPATINISTKYADDTELNEIPNSNVSSKSSLMGDNKGLQNNESSDSQNIVTSLGNSIDGLDKTKSTSLEWVNPFSDVNHFDWFYNYVAVVYSNKIMMGTSQTTFEPNTHVTRAMFTFAIANFDKVDLSDYVSARFFDDTIGQWYSTAIEWAAEQGIVSGVGNHKFDPDANVTREQMAVMLNNYIKYRGVDFSESQKYTAFADENEISFWAKDAVRVAQSIGIVSGKPGNVFDPKASTTRAEVATIFARFSEKINM